MSLLQRENGERERERENFSNTIHMILQNGEVPNKETYNLAPDSMSVTPISTRNTKLSILCKSEVKQLTKWTFC